MVEGTETTFSFPFFSSLQGMSSLSLSTFEMTCNNKSTINLISCTDFCFEKPWFGFDILFKVNQTFKSYYSESSLNALVAKML